MVVKTMSGSETRNSGNAKVHVFWCPTPEERVKFGDVGETFLNNAKRMRGDLTQMSFAQENAFPGLRKELGTWKTQVWNLPEGMILKVFASTKTNWNTLMNRGTLYLRVRDGAAFRRILIPLTGAEGARFTHASLEGSVDILTLDEVKGYGINVAPQFEPMCGQAAVRKTFQFEELQPEKSPKALRTTTTIQTDEGKEKVIVSRKRRRSMDLGR